MSETKTGEIKARQVEAHLHAELERLARRNSDLERISQDLKRFALAASHDLREPLRMISSYAQLLIRTRSGKLDSEAAQFVANIVEGAARMSELLTDLLVYIDISVRPEAPDLVDLNAVLDCVKQNLKTAIDESRAIISSDDLPVVSGHRTDFILLFQNLLANASKYRGESAPHIHISFEQADDEGRVAVSDNGIGIDSTHHRQIFEPFKRLWGRNIPGTGLGLAICQRVMNRYAGRIWVESAEGRGASFIFAIPDATIHLRR